MAFSRGRQTTDSNQACPIDSGFSQNTNRTASDQTAPHRALDKPSLKRTIDPGPFWGMHGLRWVQHDGKRAPVNRMSTAVSVVRTASEVQTRSAPPVFVHGDSSVLLKSSGAGESHESAHTASDRV